MLPTQADSRASAERWVSEWNRKNVEAMLTHFSDEWHLLRLVPKRSLGSSRVEGKAKLREYWSRTLSRLRTIHFVWGVVWVAEIDSRRMRAVEFFKFGNDGRIHEGEAMLGVEL
jgi:chromosome condensin MukBEF MukE localization factor